jgi:hypothetical protein
MQQSAKIAFSRNGAAQTERRVDRIIPGQSRKPFRVVNCDVNGDVYTCEAEYGTVEEVNSHHYRGNRIYKFGIAGIDESMGRCANI